jgi:hypothetical protein
MLRWSAAPASGYTFQMPIPFRMPIAVRLTRVLMFVVAGLTLVMLAGFLSVEGTGMRAVALAIGYALPAAAGLGFAVLIPRGYTWLRWSIIGLEVTYLLLAGVHLALGDPRAITTMILPTVILVLVTQPSARQFFHQEPIY